MVRAVKTRGAAGKGPQEQVAQRWSLIQIALDHLHEGFSVYDADLNLAAWNTAFLEHNLPEANLPFLTDA